MILRRKARKNYTSFAFLNIAQFLGAMNDNIFKLLLVFLLIDIKGAENSPVILATAGAVFVIPFLLFSQASGVLADRISKRNIVVFTKFLELFVMLLGVLAFALRTETFSYVILFLMATQSAIFGPSKYGIIPELVKKDRIAKANGLLSLFSFTAIVFGTFLAAFLTDITERNFVLTALFCSFISLLGIFASLKIEKTPPSGSHKKFNPFFLYEIYKTLARSLKYNHLLTSVLASAFFFFVGAFMQLNIIPFAMSSLGLTDVQGGYLFLLVAIGIGTGSFLAGIISGKQVELGLVPIGGLGIVGCCIVLTIFPTHLNVVAGSITLLGVFGGFFIVPVDSFIQITSPKEYRGQTLATMNFMSFIGVLCASMLLMLFSEKFALTPNQGFIGMGLITLFVTLIITITILDYFVRFLSLVVSNILFRVRLNGKKNVPASGPVLLICRHSSWVNAMLLLATQRRGMRFIIKCKNDYRWLAPLYRIMKIIPITNNDGPFHTAQLLKDIHRGFRRDFSVCIYINDNEDEEQPFRHNPIQQILNEPSCPVVPVWTTQKNRSQRFSCAFKRFFRFRGRTRAMITFGKEISRKKTSLEIYHSLINEDPYRR
ncbi:MAG: MFS transporter [Waddliaceae bacterium]|nr:MFS transporter [Waddliaceae bacterium]MBT7264279.1 MFS transporter [Waddliaceae bacterium]